MSFINSIQIMISIPKNYGFLKIHIFIQKRVLHFVEGTCLDGYFECDNGFCVPISDVCNFRNDCLDNSDEYCGQFLTSPLFPPFLIPKKKLLNIEQVSYSYTSNYTYFIHELDQFPVKLLFVNNHIYLPCFIPTQIYKCLLLL